LPRVKQIIKKVGTTCAIIAFYSPVIIYIYSYVIKRNIYNRPDSSLTK